MNFHASRSVASVSFIALATVNPGDELWDAVIARVLDDSPTCCSCRRRTVRSRRSFADDHNPVRLLEIVTVIFIKRKQPIQARMEVTIIQIVKATLYFLKSCSRKYVLIGSGGGRKKGKRKEKDKIKIIK